MRTSFAVFILLLCASVQVMAQNPDYVVYKGAYMQGHVMTFRNGTLEFKRSELEEAVVYSLNDVSEYGFQGRSFEALMIQSTREFYQRHVHGKVSLYERRGDFVLKSNDNLIPLNRKNFRTVISNAVKCEGKSPSLSQLTYTEWAMKGVIVAHNEGECNADLIPYRKIGIAAGYGFVTTKASTHVTISFKETDMAPSFRVFADFPMKFRRPGAYFCVEALGTSFQSSYYSQSVGKTAFMTLRVNGITAATSFKFIRKQGNIRPYVKLGAVGSFFRINTPTGLLTSEAEGSVINIKNELLVARFNSTQLGYNTAFGLEIPIHGRKNLHLELKHTSSLPIDRSDVDLRLSTFTLLAGFNF